MQFLRPCSLACKRRFKQQRALVYRDSALEKLGTLIVSNRFILLTGVKHSSMPHHEARQGVDIIVKKITPTEQYNTSSKPSLEQQLEWRILEGWTWISAFALGIFPLPA